MTRGDHDDDDVHELPTAHAVALRLRRDGADDEAIARALGVDVDTVPTLIEIAQRKLAAIEEKRRR